jgi:hypothetical protein
VALPGIDSGPDQPIRVMIVNLPGKLAQLVEDIVRQQPDMRYLGMIDANLETREGNLRLLQVVRENIDVLVMHTPKANLLPGVFTHLLGQYTDLKLLVVSEADELMVGYWMGLQLKQLTNVSSSSLLDNIRYLATLNPTPQNHEGNRED